MEYILLIAYALLTVAWITGLILFITVMSGVGNLITGIGKSLGGK